MCYQEHHRKSNFRPPLSRQRLLGARGGGSSPFEYLNPRGFPWGSAHPEFQVMFEEELLCSVIDAGAAIVRHRPRRRLIIGL